VIDHGVCFSAEPKLRTVIWDFVGEAIPAPMLEDLRRLQASLESGPAPERLGSLLSAREVGALRRRLDELVREGVFPEPGPGRPYPWPVL
jgi:uncharacterized repeat protein (TIGR03843 family)